MTTATDLDAETLDRDDSDEPAPRAPWPVVDDDSPAEALWRGRMQAEVDGLHEGLALVLSTVRRMDERQARGGPGIRMATTLGTAAVSCVSASATSLASVAIAAIGEKGANVKYFVGGFVVAVAIAYGATVGLGTDGVTVGGTAAAHEAGP